MYHHSIAEEMGIELIGPMEKYKLNCTSSVNALNFPTERVARSRGLKIPSFYKTYFDFLNTSKEQTVTSLGGNILDVCKNSDGGGDARYENSLDRIDQEQCCESSLCQASDTALSDETSQFETYAQKNGASTGFTKAER